MNKNLFKYYDEYNNIIDHLSIEYIEQELAYKYIEPNHCVLELGARYGSVSCAINSKLINKYNQVSVEPDERVWDALENNKKINNCFFHIIKGFISKKKLKLINLNTLYGTTYENDENSQIPIYNINEIEKLYNIKFDVLFADCEGYLETFLNENINMLNDLKLIIYEADVPDKCNYNNIINLLINNKFKLIESIDYAHYKNFYNIWIKY